MKPLYSGGLWLAVMHTPRGAPAATTWQETIGVVTGPSGRIAGTPFPSRTAATASAKREPRNRTSCPTGTGEVPPPSSWIRSATAWDTARTLSKVNPSATTARQPSVPKRIAMSCPILFAPAAARRWVVESR